MFSNSNSYMGGNSQRPGDQQQQYGGGFNGGAGGSQQGQFAAQQTGFGQQGQQQSLQQQFTGYPMPGQQTGFGQMQQPLQQQYTGFPGQGQPNMQTGAPPMPSMPQQFQQQFQQQQQQGQQSPSGFGTSSPQQAGGIAPPPPPVKPQATGFNEMAASFKSPSSAPKPQGRREKAKTNTIPNQRLSFITAQDQSKFETLFRAAVGDSSTMSGDKARELLLRSKLDGDTLSNIW